MSILKLFHNPDRKTTIFQMLHSPIFKHSLNISYPTNQMPKCFKPPVENPKNASYPG